jgi:hypothetical protein
VARGRKRTPGIGASREEVEAMLATSPGARADALDESDEWTEEPLPFAWEPDTLKEARGEA